MALASLDWRQETLLEPRPTILLGADLESDALATALRSDGYDVLEASNTTEVIDRFKYIRKVDRAVPVVVVTDSAAETDVEEADRLGATVVFHRPFDVDDLRTAVVNSIPTL
jgi:DNA-binding NarL/FixJ family response regulator